MIQEQTEELASVRDEVQQKDNLINELTQARDALDNTKLMLKAQLQESTRGGEQLSRQLIETQTELEVNWIN